MIQVDDTLDATPVVEWRIREATRLLGNVRTSGSQAATISFLRCVRDVALELDAVMGKVSKCLDTDGLGDELFAKAYAAGASHGATLAFCRSFANDPSHHVRMACAAGEMVLGQISPDHFRAIEAVRKRLNNKS